MNDDAGCDDAVNCGSTPNEHAAAVTFEDFDPFDFIDDDWIEAVVALAATLPGRQQDYVPAVRAAAPAKCYRREIPGSKVTALADRLRGKR